jgi:polyisoprenoid-binding protein YceI
MKRMLLLAVTAIALPAFAAPETYVVDPRHTFPSYEIGHNGYSFQRGRFNKTTGKILLDTQAKKGGAEIVIDATSVSTGVEKLEEHIRSDDFLKTKAHPQITFKSSQFEFEGEKLKRAVGDLTMAGVTRPVTLDVTHFHCEPHKTLKVKVCGAELVGKIKRSEFGIVYGLPALADEMTLRIGVEAREERNPA